MTEQSQQLVVHRDVSGPLEFTAEQRQMIRDTYAPGATEAEFRVMMEVARLRRLNPLLKQIHFVKRRNRKLNRDVWTPQTSIDGMRAIAERTGNYAGQDEPEYELDKEGFILSCKVKVYRKDWGSRPAVGVAHWSEYVQTYDGKPTDFWERMPRVMIAKCAEAIAIRKAFPEDAGDLYVDEEMQQADNVPQLSDNGTAGAFSSHDASPDENPQAINRESYKRAMAIMAECDKAVFDPGCTWETMTRWRGIMGSKGQPSALGKEMSEMYRGDLNEGERKDLSALWNRVDRKLTALDGKLKPPPIESSFLDPDDNEEPWADEARE